MIYLIYAAKIGYKSAVVRTPDSDIFFILLHHANNIPLTIYLDIGSGKHRQIVNVSEAAASKGKVFCTTIFWSYVYTGEDVTSVFKGKDKVGPLKKLLKNPRYQAAFRLLGNEWTVPPNVLVDIELFTCVMWPS